MDQNPVQCPKCGASSHTKKGKTSNGQFQKLKCKKCGRQYRVELAIYDKQLSIPIIETRIVKYPNGGYSVCKIARSEFNSEWTNCLLILTPKTRTHKETLQNIRKNEDIILDDRTPIELKNYIPETVVNDLKKLFGDQQTHAWKNILNQMVK